MNNSLDTVNHPCQLGKSGTPSKIQVPICQLRTKLQTGLSKDSSLKTAMFNFSCTAKHQEPVSTLVVSTKERKINIIDKLALDISLLIGMFTSSTFLLQLQ